MADRGLEVRLALAGIAQAGRHGSPDGMPGAILEQCTDVQISTVMARKGQEATVATAVRDAWGLDLPSSPRRVCEGNLAFVWSGPGHWTAVAEGWAIPLDVALRQRLRGLASVSAQGDGRVLLRLSGPRARDVLSKGVGIDLHPRAFRAGDAASTLAAHIGVQIWQRDDAPTFEVSAFRSYARSLYGWLISAGEEYGIDVRTPAGESFG